MTASFCFTVDDLLAFRTVSGDSNPLHVDPDYARRTPYGRVVVHGVAVILRAIAHWSEGRGVTLGTLKGQFRRPVHPDDPVTCEARCRGDTVELEVRRGATPCVRIQLQVVPRVEPLHTGDASDSGGLVAWQQAVLLWASRFVGMENPGRQALFSALEIDFARSRDALTVGAPPPFCPTELAVEENDRFRLVTVRGRGPGVTRFHLEAFRRPLPVEISRADVEAVIGRSQRWAGTVALVAGAGRGFGRALSIALELHGATVAAVSRSDADLASEVDCAHLLEVHRARHRRIDLLVLNASPPIEPRAFADQSAAWLDAFLTASVRACAVLLRGALPLVPQGGRVLLISSGWVGAPVRQFSHYVAAKAALEGLLHGVSAECADRDYIVARLPRMLTDQTNILFDAEPPLSAPVIAERLLSALAAQDGRGYTILELGTGSATMTAQHASG